MAAEQAMSADALAGVPPASGVAPLRGVAEHGEASEAWGCYFSLAKRSRPACEASDCG